MSKSEVRDSLIEKLYGELIGPKDKKDEFEELPTNRYILGVLFPKETKVGDEFLEADTEAEAEGIEDQVNIMSAADRLRPSSMGISVWLDKAAREVEVKVVYAIYKGIEDKGTKYGIKFVRSDRTWSGRIHFDMQTTQSIPIDEDVRIELICKTYQMASGNNVVSIFLVNKEKTTDNARELNLKCIFSPKIEVVSEDKNMIANLRSRGDEEDLRSLNILYHDRHEFGTGHGCSVEWDQADGTRCGVVRSTFMPLYYQRSLDFMEDKFDLDMLRMSKQDEKTKTMASLSALVQSYQDWIDETFSPSRTGLFRDQETIREHEQYCRESLQRMKDGIELLNDRKAFESFSFMNEAMGLQRLHKKAADNNIEGRGYQEPNLSDLDGDERPKWRPFQMGFILQCLPSITNPDDAHRRTVDLLWVPTGGGKTEAYLGLSAYILAYRRLRKSTDVLHNYSGVSIMMRYTLRLLTIQQFQRAAVLFCAMEVIRRLNPVKWGRESFLVGLYIGSDITPNKIGKGPNTDYEDTAYYAYRSYRSSNVRPNQYNPFQLIHCPWCGEELDPSSYRILENSRYLITHCKREGCVFKSDLEIPAITVDENIYGRLPSMIISTVDKLAQLPFNTQVGSLFGHVNSYCPTHGYYQDAKQSLGCKKHGGGRLEHKLDPPDLIIQDELHLINGGLGSLFGMYETSIMKLCEGSDESTPKYIASTATIRGARDQISNLFARDFRRYPSPGTSYGDSFFVKEFKDNHAAKAYLGLFPSGKGQKSVMVRTLACLLKELALIKADKVIDLEDWDNYWTLVSYYDSIRALGGAVTTVNDDVQIRVGQGVRQLNVEELTSRVDAKRLTEILARMAVTGEKDESYDVLACSNMFSVGVDVTRLGTMVVNNQPKNASEYIQATGRVGRDRTGLVITIFNWNRPRDQSHFEHFYDFHNRIQSHVETMTVTPFSRGARERALHAQYVSLLRIMGDRTLSDDDGARNYSGSNRSKHAWIEETLRLRAEGLKRGLGPIVMEELKMFTDDWIDKAEALDELVYRSWEFHGRKQNCPNTVMVTSSANENNLGPAKMTPLSMRNIEEEVQLFKINF